MLYGTETWIIEAEIKRYFVQQRWTSTGGELLKYPERKKLSKTQKYEKKKKMYINTIHHIGEKLLPWFGYAISMNNERLPKVIMEC